MVTAKESSEDRAARRFAREAAGHAMTVLHDDGSYRHLRFQREVWRPPLAQPLKSSAYWFDLITAPGTLIFEGDGTAFVFRRVDDMFAFFRGPVGQINPGYWAQKVVSGQDGIRSFDQDVFQSRVIKAFVDEAPYGVPRGTGRALREQIFENEEIYYESGARDALDRFEHNGYRFTDAWEWDLRNWDWWFLWACHAIVWGIAYYDAKAKPAMPEPQGPAQRRKFRPEPRVVSDSEPVGGAGFTRRDVNPAPRPIVDVHLPEPVGGAA